ncbi:10 transmembrane domain, possible aa transporter, putative [Perkinsus marinus ATCC 50983]|uniref:10 transmembrane domain, possible aa transporter, putative n=1 Tax=Perkinsus marinus (strain ATCC 50983 / TXsc) TaxID=423536 RepID=C5KT73_PERM5|nr:10 transmembrane domain, possible aa transporter, putative [Perkinsus marinus ATCC 50983]EER12423.1 10 transmembrane domain, possible aa transporter, putative [Perkinsus marinus ATCC 50983]|eukprot:XP_002780628.1 10 transmembrane domain, possible aa transporter, putative [Perkinsus marinus ATCC 50983]
MAPAARRRSHESIASLSSVKSLEAQESRESVKVGGTPDFTAIFNVVMTAVGVGLLALAKATASVGYATGIFYMLVCGVLGWCMVYLLYRCRVMALTLGLDHVPTYEDIGRAAFGRIGRVVVAISLHISLVGTSCVLMLLLGQNSHHIYDGIGVNIWIVIWAVILTPVNWLKTMREIGFMASTVGVFSIVVTLVGLTAAGFSQAYSASAPYEAIVPKPLSIIGGYTTFSFAYSVTCSTTTVTHDMRHPTHAPKVFAISFAGLISIYGLVTLAGYLGWGQKLLCYDNVLEAMSKDAFGYVSFIGIIILSATHYAVLLHPSCRAIEYLTGLEKGTTKARRLGRWPTLLITSGLRSLLVVVTAVIAITVPNFSLQIDLLSAVTYTLIHLIFPPLFYMRLKHKSAGYGRPDNMSSTKGKLLTVSLLLLMAIALMASGVTIYKTVQPGPTPVVCQQTEMASAEAAAQGKDASGLEVVDIEDWNETEIDNDRDLRDDYDASANYEMLADGKTVGYRSEEEGLDERWY